MRGRADPAASAREPDVPPLLGRSDDLPRRRSGDADRAPARRRPRARRERGADGLSRRRRADAEPALLAARRRVGRPPCPQAADDDRDRHRPRAGARLDPARLRVRRAHVPAHVRRRVPDGDAHRRLPRLLQRVLPRTRAARAARRGRLDHAREPGALVRRRPEHRRPARAGDLGAGDARPRRLLLPRVGPLPRPSRRRGAADGDARRGSRRRRRALGLRQSDHPGRAGRDRDDQLLQLRLLRALHPLRDHRARRLARDARARARRRRRSAASWARSSPAASRAGSASAPRSRSGASSSPRRSCSSRSRTARRG